MLAVIDLPPQGRALQRRRNWPLPAANENAICPAPAWISITLKLTGRLFGRVIVTALPDVQRMQVPLSPLASSTSLLASISD